MHCAAVCELSASATAGHLTLVHTCADLSGADRRTASVCHVVARRYLGDGINTGVTVQRVVSTNSFALYFEKLMMMGWFGTALLTAIA